MWHHLILHALVPFLGNKLISACFPLRDTFYVGMGYLDTNSSRSLMVHQRLGLINLTILVKLFPSLLPIPLRMLLQPSIKK